MTTPRTKNTNTVASLLLGLFAAIFLVLPISARSAVEDWTEEQLRDAFDEVARNFGAAEYATYTFMVEFGRAPESLDELRETGHLNVLMTNPYTGGDVIGLSEKDVPDGDLAGNIYMVERAEGEEAHIAAFYVRIRNGHSSSVRSMIKRIFLYQSEVDYEYMFREGLLRDEQMVTVYCVQAVDALESFQQRNGRSPEDWDDFYWNGDVNVHYVNPITGELAVSSEQPSPGDFFYKKIGEEGFTLIGWGREQPVFFATTDEDEERWFYEAFPEAAGEEKEPEENNCRASGETDEASEPENERGLGVELFLEVTDVTSPVCAGEVASLTARALSGANCAITVYYKSGPSQAEDLERKNADQDGIVSWCWTVGPQTTPGTWRIEVTAEHNGHSVIETVYFEVI